MNKMRKEIIVWASIAWHIIVGITLLITEDALQSSYVSGITDVTFNLDSFILGIIAILVASLAIFSMFARNKDIQFLTILPQQLLLMLSMYSLIQIMITGKPPELDFALPRGLLIPGLSFGALMAMGHTVAIWKYFIWRR